LLHPEDLSHLDPSVEEAAIFKQAKQERAKDMLLPVKKLQIKTSAVPWMP